MISSRRTGGWGKLLVMAGAALALGIFSGSKIAQNHEDGGGASYYYADADQAMQTQLSGSIRIVGSTSMEKLASALAEGFMEKYPEVTVTVQFAGSSAGIMAVAEGSADIGISSRELKKEEEALGIVGETVALDGIAACVGPESAVSNLTKQQLIDIYTGKITNWSILGGADIPIVVVGREAGSGTRSAFEGMLDIEGKCTYANELDSTGAVMARITSIPGTIGYVSFDIVNNDIIALSLEGVEPNAENVKTGSYFMCRPFIMAVKGEIAVQSRPVREWFAYVYSEEGRRIAEKLGYISAVI